MLLSSALRQTAQPDYVALAMVLVLLVIFAIISIIILATKLINYLFSDPND